MRSKDELADLEITPAMIEAGTLVMRESGALAREASADSVLVSRILEAAVAAHTGGKRNLEASLKSRQNALRVARYL